MSIKRMITKLALAFAAKKGIDAFNSMGGLSGLKAALQNPAEPANQRGGMQGRVGGADDAQSGGLGNILGSLGAAGATGPREAGVTGQVSPLNQSLGALFGNLASALGRQVEPDAAARDMEEQLDLEDVESESDAKPVLRAMVQMARADGAIDTAEQETLFQILDDASPSEKAILQDALREPVEPEALAASTPHHARKEVYSAALLVGHPENEKEQQFLESLAFSLGLSHDDVLSLNRAMGKDKTLV